MLVAVASRRRSRIASSVEKAETDYVTAVETGVPSHEIVEYAADADVGAIVMGKRGPSDAAADLLGRTTERVLRDAPTTVVAVPSERDAVAGET